jgi:hypothetical protein
MTTGAVHYNCCAVSVPYHFTRIWIQPKMLGVNLDPDQFEFRPVFWFVYNAACLNRTSMNDARIQENLQGLLILKICFLL